MDALGAEKEQAEELLKVRRDSLEKAIGSSEIGKNYSKQAPSEDLPDIVYPTYDRLTNYIVFVSRPRRKREAAARRRDTD